jgi:hypothetical protein
VRRFGEHLGLLIRRVAADRTCLRGDTGSGDQWLAVWIWCDNSTNIPDEDEGGHRAGDGEEDHEPQCARAA